MNENGLQKLKTLIGKMTDRPDLFTREEINGVMYDARDYQMRNAMPDTNKLNEYMLRLKYELTYQKVQSHSKYERPEITNASRAMCG